MKKTGFIIGYILLLFVINVNAQYKVNKNRYDSHNYSYHRGDPHNPAINNMVKKEHLLLIFGIFLILSFILLSCVTSEKTAVSCPEVSINKNNKFAIDNKRIKNKAFTTHFRVITRKQPVRPSGKNQGKDFAVFKNSIVQDDLKLHSRESVFDMNKIEYLKGLTTSRDNAISHLGRNSTTSQLMKKIDVNIQSKNIFITHSSGYDTILLKSGSILIVKVEETGQFEIKYRECNNLNGPIIIISKSDVSEIRYTNGANEILTAANPYDYVLNNATINDDNPSIRKARIRIAGFVYTLAGLFVFSGFLVLGLPGVVFAAVALGLIGVVRRGISRTEIKRNPDKFKGKRSEIGSLIIDIVVVLGVVLGLLLLIFFIEFFLGSLI